MTGGGEECKQWLSFRDGLDFLDSLKIDGEHVREDIQLEGLSSTYLSPDRRLWHLIGSKCMRCSIAPLLLKITYRLPSIVDQ